MSKKLIPELISILFTILFLYTGIIKLMDYSVFKEQIGQSPILAPVANGIAIVLPILEILTAILLFIPRTRLIGLYVSSVLMAAFTGYIIYILSYNKHLPCTCGGIIEALSWPQHLVFNIVAICMAVSGILLEKRKPSGLSKEFQSLARS